MAKKRAQKKKSSARKGGKPASSKGAGPKAPRDVPVPEKLGQIYEGKAKKLFATSDPGLLICHFKDDATAFNAQKRGIIVNKGVFNNDISSHLYKMLEKRGVRTHLVKKLSEREQLVRKVEIIPVEVIIRNLAAGSLAKRLGLAEGTPLKFPIVEWCYKSDKLGDPIVSDEIAVALGWASAKEMTLLKHKALEVDRLLTAFFAKLGIKLVDFKLEFGRFGKEILLADEITPDGCRLWDAQTNEKLDKDRFRHDLGGVEEAYQRVHAAVLGA